VPLAVLLGSTGMALEPPLPPVITRGLRTIAPAQYLKVILAFERPPLPLCDKPLLALLGVLDDDGAAQGAGAAGKPPPRFLLVENGAALKGAPTLTGVLCGAAATSAGEHAAAALLAQVASHASAAGWPPLPTLLDSHVTNWHELPLTGGAAYSFLPAGADADAVDAAIDGLAGLSPRLAFAGEALDLDHMGALHAAANTGAAAAAAALIVAEGAGGEGEAGSGDD
jgi:hypothetical protein